MEKDLYKNLKDLFKYPIHSKDDYEYTFNNISNWDEGTYHFVGLFACLHRRSKNGGCSATLKVNTLNEKVRFY